MKVTTIYAFIWLGTGIATAMAIYIAKEAYPILAMLIPAFIRIEIE